jgi:hypothetical protein
MPLYDCSSSNSTAQPEVRTTTFHQQLLRKRRVVWFHIQIARTIHCSGTARITPTSLESATQLKTYSTCHQDPSGPASPRHSRPTFISPVSAACLAWGIFDSVLQGLHVSYAGSRNDILSIQNSSFLVFLLRRTIVSCVGWFIVIDKHH